MSNFSVVGLVAASHPAPCAALPVPQDQENQAHCRISRGVREVTGRTDLVALRAEAVDAKDGCNKSCRGSRRIGQ